MVQTAPALIHNVQALRAIAAMFAVLAHLQGYLAEIFGLTVPFGGVDLFFVISGYIMAYTTTDRVTPRVFMIRRISRIVPLYWVATLGVFSLALIAPSVVKSTNADFGELIQSLLFIPFAKTNGIVQPTLFVGWTLNYEMMFYIIFAGALLLRSENTRFIVVSLVLIGLVAIGQIFEPKSVLADFYTSSIVLNFLLGMVVARVMPMMPRTAPRGLLPVVLVLGALALAGATLIPLFRPDMPSVITCGAPSALLVGLAVLAERWGWRITSPTFVLLGDATYSIYLTHPFIAEAVQKITEPLHAGPIGAFGFLIVAMVISALVGIVVYKMVEVPLCGWAKRLLSAQRSKKAAAAPEERSRRAA